MACHFGLVGRMILASLEANLGGGWGLFVYPILLFSLLLSGRSPNMTEILLTGTLSLNSISQSINQYLNYLPTGKLCKLFLSIADFFPNQLI